MTLEKERKMDAARILLADDEATFLAATADLLRREGYVCDEVGDAAAALALVSEGHYDLLITDLEMPGNADLQLVRDVGARSGGLPVIILTGYPSVRSAVASIELPVAAYLTKPVSFPLLLEIGERAHDSAQRQREEDVDRVAVLCHAPGVSDLLAHAT